MSGGWRVAYLCPMRDNGWERSDLRKASLEMGIGD